jgi:hypothetical protein
MQYAVKSAGSVLGLFGAARLPCRRVAVKDGSSEDSFAPHEKKAVLLAPDESRARHYLVQFKFAG